MNRGVIALSPLLGALICPLGGQVVSTDPSSAYREGQAALARHDIAAAQSAFERALRQSPNYEPALSALGAVLLQRGDTAGAVKQLQTARAISRTDLNAELNLAIAYQQTQQPSKATPLFADAIAVLRRNKQAVPVAIRASYARALAATGRLPQAASEMAVAVRAEPKDAVLISDLGSIYAQEKDWPHAESAFRTSIAQQPDSAPGHFRLGLALQAQGKESALDELGTAARLAPDEAEVQLPWGKALATSGDDTQAVAVFEHVLILKPQSSDAMEQLAEAYQRNGRVQEAVDLFHKVVIAQPNNAKALTNLGLGYTQLQRAKDAVPFLQRAVKVAPSDVTARQDLAAAYVLLSQFDDAATELRAALKIEPLSPRLHYNLGFALKGEDNTVPAIAELQQAEKLDPNAPEPPYVLGVLFMQAGRYAEASTELQRSLRLRPDNGDGWATLGSVYNKLNQLPEAADALAKAVQQIPSQPDPHLTLAAVLSKQGKAEEATSERRTAATLMKANMNRQRAEVQTHSAAALVKSGDLMAAIQQYNDALKDDPNYAEAHLGLAQVYELQGRTADAASERTKAAGASTTPQ